MSGVSRRRFLAGSAALGLTPFLNRLPAFGHAGHAGRRVVELARVPAAQAHLLQGFDVVCGQSTPGFVEVLLWPGDKARLRSSGVDHELYVEDVVDPLDHAGYRHLHEYDEAMHDLAARFPDRVRTFTLPEKTVEGRTITAIEIASDVSRVDGRPCFYMDGVHHAREWPSGEVSMMFAIDLAEGYDTDARIRGLVDRVRTIVVPIVNPDGFNYSRTSLAHVEEVPVEGAYWRKNRRGVTDDLILENRPPKPYSADAYGVDVNRNYSHHWAGWGGGTLMTDLNYCGEKAFSEPETRNVRSILLTRPITALISNHTYSDLIIRPWGDTWEDSPDEPLLRRLGADMARTNGFRNIKGLELYGTTGTTSDYGYAALAALSYTFEHGHRFHPPYAEVPPMYARTREAFLIALEAAANPAYHSVVAGRAKGSNGLALRAKINVVKQFRMPEWHKLGAVERQDIVSQAGGDGRFELHLSPSTRPVADEESYAVVFTAPGYRPAARHVVVGRGKRVDLGDVILQAG